MEKAPEVGDVVEFDFPRQDTGKIVRVTGYVLENCQHGIIIGFEGSAYRLHDPGSDWSKYTHVSHVEIQPSPHGSWCMDCWKPA